MDPTDLKRYIEKFMETVEWCRTFFMRQSESYAAQHLSNNVFYSPICQRLEEMRLDLQMMQAKLELDATTEIGEK